VVDGSSGTDRAIVGYDLVSGLGVPNVRALIGLLA
jgi:hypothetical protein